MFTWPLLLVLHQESISFVFSSGSCRTSGSGATVAAAPGTGHLNSDVGEDGPGHAGTVGN